MKVDRWGAVKIAEAEEEEEGDTRRYSNSSRQVRSDEKRLPRIPLSSLSDADQGPWVLAWKEPSDVNWILPSQ